MSSDPMSDEQPEVDDEAVPEVVRKPTRTAGDMSEAAGVSAGITLEGLLRRVRRIEEYLGISDPLEPEAFEYPDKPFGQAPRRYWEQPPTVHSSGGEQSGPTRTPEERLASFTRAQHSSEGDTDRLEESSKPED